MPPAKKREKSPFAAFAGAERSPPRPQLTRERIITAALEVLNESGFDGLTMRRLAERLDIKAASLYNHVSDKDELLALLADAISAEIPLPAQGRSWRQQTETLARQFRRVLMAHRDAARVLAATPPAGPHRLQLIEASLRVLGEAGFPAALTADACYLLNSYIVGFVLDETLGHSGEPLSAKRRREEGRRWFKALPKQDYPTLIALADELIDAPPERRFELGLRALLDGLELRVAAT